MKLVSIETIPGQEFEALDIVRGTVVYSKNFGRDFMAGMKTLVGGEITGYTEMLVEARQIATKRMVDAAEALGADAVIIARPFVTAVYGGGREGVESYINKIGAELKDTMAMCGVASLDEITRDCVRR